ncbi:hypothetical protein JCM10213_005997 [Rhodosporidiobolus nylandii]
MNHLSPLERLPLELLAHTLLPHLPLPSLLSLRLCSRTLRSAVEEHLPSVLRSLGYAPCTIAHLPFHRHAPAARKALWATSVVRRFEAQEFRGSVLGGQRGGWRKCLPVVKLWEPVAGEGALLVARGRGMELWHADPSAGGGMRGADVLVDGFDGGRREEAAGATKDVTALCGGIGLGEVTVARVDGTLSRLRVRSDERRAGGGGGGCVRLAEKARYDAFPSASAGGKTAGRSSTIQALASEGGVLAAAGTTRLPPGSVAASAPATPAPASPFSSRPSTPSASLPSLAASLSSRAVSSSHSISLHALASPWQPPEVVPLSTKPWSLLLSPSSSSASAAASPSWLAIGHTGISPLSLLPLTPSGPLPSALQPLSHTRKTTSVYALASPPSSSPLSPSHTVIAAFYDSTTRVFDLRVPPPSSSSSSSWNDGDDDFRPANEIARLADPWSDDPSYSLACGGPSGSAVFVGTARNAALRIFDLRSASRSSSITAYAPGRDRSPVYSLAAEGSRVYGATESRGFVLDWDPWPERAAEGVAFVRHSEGGAMRWSDGRGV